MKANHADLRIVQRIASKYYDLNISADGALICTKSPDAPNPMTPVADSFLTTLKAVFDRIPLDIAEGPVRCSVHAENWSYRVADGKFEDYQPATR